MFITQKNIKWNVWNYDKLICFLVDPHVKLGTLIQAVFVLTISKHIQLTAFFTEGTNKPQKRKALEFAGYEIR